MSKIGRTAIVVVLVAAVAVVIAVKENQSNRSATETVEAASAGRTILPQARAEDLADQPAANGLPALIDLGAGECIPCKMMAPILEELKKEYAGRFEVRFIDVWKNPDEAGKYGIKLIPTQIFHDASGKELFRHEGFFSKEDILSKWKELGVDLSATSLQVPAFERLTPAKADNPQDACDGSDRQRAGATMQPPLLLHHVLVPDRGQSWF